MTRVATAKRFVGGLALLVVIGAACARPTASPTDNRTIAFLRAVPSGASEFFFEELRRAGYIRGQNLDVLDGDPATVYVDADEIREAVERWTREGVDLIIAYSTSGARIASETAPDVPIVSITNDPVLTGLVADGTSPQGSITGVTFRVPADRTLDVARRAIGELGTVGLVYADGDPASVPHRDAVAAAGRKLGITVRAVSFTGTDDAAAAVAALPADTGAVFISNSPTAVRNASVIVDAADGRSLPVIANSSFISNATIVLEPDVDELTRQLGRQAARILRGVAIADIPVEDPVRYRLVVDVSVAERLGIDVPDTVLREADEVIR